MEKIKAIIESLDDNYTIKYTLNYVKNAGVSFAEAIYDVTTDSTDEIKADIVLYDGDGNEVLKNSKSYIPVSGTQTITIKLDVPQSASEYTVKSTLYKGDTAIAETITKTIKNSDGNFADTSLVNLKKGSLLEKSEQVGLDYILNVDIDRLLAPSYQMHNLTPPNHAERYNGWEREGANNWTASSASTYTLAGHSLGHWLSAAAVFYRDTGNSEVIEMLNYAVSKLDELQTVTGSGYIGGCKEATFTNMFEGNISNNAWVNGYWVPWYGIHKIYQGLLDAYDYTDNQTAFKVLKKFADWAVDGCASLTDAEMQTVLDVEYGGMNEIFARMYELTGNSEYLITARRFTHDNILNPLISNTDSLTGLHANTQIPKIIGAAEIYEQDREKYADYRTACENFWNMVVNTRSYVIGGNSIAEHFEAQGAESLGVKTCESCNTYNMMRLTEHLFSWEHNSKYMDWYEQALYNHILGQQDPKTGAKMYFVSLLQGHHRVYENKYESWWCCTGTGMENPGRYTRVAYYEDNDELYVNLYVPGEYTWNGIGFDVETDYPYSDTVKITVKEGEGNVSLNLRAPSWIESPMKVKIGNDTYLSYGNEYLKIKRNWKAGDEIDVKIPMNVRVYRSRTGGQIAYLYGPLALAADLGGIGSKSGAEEYITNETKIDSVTVDVPYLITYGNTPESIIKKADTDDLTFIIDADNSSDGKEITLKPFHNIAHSFYTLYFDLNAGTGEYDKLLNSVQIDRVEPDGQQDEIGHMGNFINSHQGTCQIGTKMYYWRDAFGSADAYFEYTVTIDKDNPNYLFVRYFGDDAGFANGGKNYTRNFNILVDGKIIANQTLNREASGQVYDVFYAIPRKYTNGKDSIVVRFTPVSDTACAGGVVELRTMSEDLTVSRSFDAKD